MDPQVQDTVPQLVAIVTIQVNGRFNLKKAARKHLGWGRGQALRLEMADELTLGTAGEGIEISVDHRNRAQLPPEFMAHLDVSGKSLLGLVQRPGRLALKAIEIEEVEGEWARLVDLETPRRIVRRAETNPMPETLLPRLAERLDGSTLHCGAADFLRGRATVEGWQARQRLGIPDASDEVLRRRLIRERLAEQGGDGSWEGHLPLTARRLRELAALGMTRRDAEVQRAVHWVMDRPQSQYNPGMFFAYDDLVGEQDRVVENRRQQRRGPRERFNERRAQEVNLVREGYDFVGWPCGPRITWTTAIVLEPLLALGYEDSPRVQAALRMLLLSRWCDNAQQHGMSGTGEIQRAEPCSPEEIDAMERARIHRYRYGGLESLKDLERADMAHQPFGLRRRAHARRGDVDEYPLTMPQVGGGCEVVMTRALSRVRDGRLRRLAESHLWQYAGWQRPPHGSLVGEYATKYHADAQAMYLDLFSRYDHPVARVAILRSVPWIIENQSADGSWGAGELRDATTLAVVRALARVTHDLPAGFLGVG